MSIDWDIDSYRTEFETEEHWELKKRFMLAHKDKFPEDELVCLAQVFTNIEFLGCRYPEPTMKRVALLAKGVVEEFREKKKNCLKRTFVAASDAASAKVKGLVAPQEVKLTPDPDEPKIQSIKNDQTNPDESTKNNETKSGKTPCKHLKQVLLKNKEPTLNLLNPLETLKLILRSQIIAQSNLLHLLLANKASVLDNFVVVYSDDGEQPLSTLQKSTAENNCQMRWVWEKSDLGGKKKGKLYINEELIAQAEAHGMKQCKKDAAKAALDVLKENCFGVKVNREYRGLLVSSKDFGMDGTSLSTSLGNNNIGAKMMLLMGWKGGGLGREEQGIKEPLPLNVLAPREGFGCNLGSSNTSKPGCELNTFKKKATEFIMNWMKSESRDDLTFSPEFTPDERRELHLIAQGFCLKSKSQGKKNNRRLCISRKQHPLEIVQELIRAGGCTNKFQLVYPNKFSNNPLGNV